MAKKEISELAIDEYNLFDECKEHANKYHEYSKMMTEEKANVQDAENEFKVMTARMRLKLRQKPKEYFSFNGGKVGNQEMLNDVMEAAFEEELAEARQRIADAQHDYETAKSMVAALYERRKMLENMVKLQLSDLNSAPELSDKEDQELTKKHTRRPRKKSVR